MRKAALAVLLLLLVSLCAAASADTVSFPTIFASCEISDDYIILTPDTLSRHPEWMLARNTDEETILADWSARGVLLQAWTTVGDAVLEITAVQDSYAQEYYDIDDQTPATRAAYRTDHKSGSELKNAGYTVTSAEWKKTEQGRFLMLQYKRVQNGQIYYGHSRKTIKNGYTINLDYQVYGRQFTGKDNSNLDKVWNTFVFNRLVDPNTIMNPDGTLPEVEANLKFTDTPPAETDTGKFNVTGTCTAGLEVLGVVMRKSSNQAYTVQTTAGKNGKFTLAVELPEEGVWLMTVNVFSGTSLVAEAVFPTTITYQKGMLVVNLEGELPTELHGDTLLLSGTTVKQTKVQCLVEGAVSWSKTVTTNNSGGFSFKVPTVNEGDYSIALVFEKKNYTTRRMTTIATRALTETDVRAKAVEEAIKPAYATLSKNIRSYTGRTMTYEMYVQSIGRSGDGWLVFMAMRSTQGGYQDIVVVQCKEEPLFAVDSLQRMYGVLNGTYVVEDSVNGDAEYPCFALLFWA